MKLASCDLGDVLIIKINSTSGLHETTVEITPQQSKFSKLKLDNEINKAALWLYLFCPDISHVMLTTS